MYYVYLLKSKTDNHIYIGYTNNINKRIKEHNNGMVFSTKHYKPWILYYYEGYKYEISARIREKKLKHHGNALKELKKRIAL